MGLLPIDENGKLRVPEKPAAGVGAFADDPVIRDIVELGKRKERDAIAVWQRDREAAFAEMIYDDLSILDDTLAQLADRSKAAATTRKYKAHWGKFAKWTAEFIMDDGYPLSPLPACAELCAFYLLTQLTAGQSYSTIKQISSAISDAHVTNHLPDPTQALVCRAAVRLARQYDGKFSKAKSNDKEPEQAVSNDKANGANGKANGSLEHEP